MTRRHTAPVARPAASGAPRPSGRRRVAAAVLLATPLALTACTGAEVQQFFTDHGHPVPQAFADKIAELGNRIQAAHPHQPCPTEAPTTAPPTTAAPEPTNLPVALRSSSVAAEPENEHCGDAATSTTASPSTSAPAASGRSRRGRR